MSSPVHLVKRALSSFSNQLPRDVSPAREILNVDEFVLWSSMQGRDQVHSLQVLSRFVLSQPSATRAERAAALLHDIGKKASDLGWALRILATLVGKRGDRFSDYHNHERIGGEMLNEVSDVRTVALVSGRANDAVSRALRDADDI